MNKTTIIIALLVLLPGCYEGPDSDFVDTDAGSTGGVDTDAESVGGDVRPSPPGPNDDSGDDDDQDDASDDGAADPEDSGPAPVDPDATLVEFHIPPGTQNEAWNTQEETLVAYVGQTLLLINDDDTRHTLHSFGVPMPHGDSIEPGESAQYLLAEPYDRGDETPQLWDHEAGEPAYFWLRVLARDSK